ncbi:MAG: HEAT repeat domain-containing protein, partial [Labilithrix sp.]|nr:HEAT repeat domain-containing protein [Labilithrix sp.]
MSTLSVVVWLVVALTSIVAVTATWVLAREAWLRWTTRHAVERLERALSSMDPANKPPADDLRSLVRRIDEGTLERALETMLRSDRDGARPWAIHLFTELGLVERFSKRVREARRWADRAHAAEVLGLGASPKAVPALVAAIRDPHEDAASVKLSAANALAALKDPGAVPLLVRELEVVDEHASPRIADALVRFGSIALPSLLEMLGNIEQGPSRVWAARVLGRIGDRSA